MTAAVTRLMTTVADALQELARGQGELLCQSAHDWASGQFTGSRHNLTFAFDGAEAVAGGEALVELLAGHPYAIPGHTVADTDVIHAERRSNPPRLLLDCTMLLLETP